MIRSTLIALVATTSLGGCALLSSPDPVQNYRFGSPSLAPAAEPGPDTPQVVLRRVEFPSAVEGDRILGVTGTETAYIKGARWVSPAEDLYSESLENAFATQATRVRAIGAREVVQGGQTLDIDIRAFEARYDAPGATPTAVISARAQLLALPGREVKAERTFTIQQPASENRVGAIVEAFDRATSDLNSQIVAWTEQNAN